MGINQYEKSKRFLKVLYQEKGEIVNINDFVFAMRIQISADKFRVQKPYFELMKDSKLIEDLGDGTIKINANLL